jgi:hypothetical protein
MLVMNLRTAKAMALTIPGLLLPRNVADGKMRALVAGRDLYLGL